jgi:hypothetical protein
MWASHNYLKNVRVPLHEAIIARNGKLEVIKLLLICGADPFIKAKVSIFISLCYLFSSSMVAK